MSFINASSAVFDPSPVRLSYGAALRGVLPRDLQDSFSYARVGDFDTEAFLCLAASNPEGRFYGLMTDTQKALDAMREATLRAVTNATFGTTDTFLPHGLDYLCGETSSVKPTEEEQATLAKLAADRLAPGGLLTWRYRAYDGADESLQFLVAEYAPELSPEEAVEFLGDLKDIGVLYFSGNPVARAALDRAVEAGMPDAFFESCLGDKRPSSGAFDAMAALLPAGFAFVGDATPSANYLDLCVPKEAHEPLMKTKGHLLYEPIKDFAMQRLIRNDVWVKLPAKQTLDNPSLFGRFTFGITTPRDRVPTRIETASGFIDLTAPLYAKLIDLMCLLPMGIGDFLQHPTGKSFAPDDVLTAVQALVAGGVAQPMRGRYEKGGLTSTAFPVWSTGFNAYFKDNPIAAPSVRLASPIVGGVVTLPARDAFVLQALSRVGLENSAGSLLLELEQLVDKNPALASQVMDCAKPSDESVQSMIVTIVEKNMVRWYAYGLLAA